MALYTDEYLEELQKNVRLCMLEGITNNIPFTCGLSRSCYNNHFSKNVLKFIPWGSVGVIEKHEDVYLHAVPSLELANQILEDGYLRVKYSDENNHIGKAIYTYPLDSGRLHNMPYVIRFTTDQKHIHIVEYNDGNAVLGETDFLEDVKLINPEILTLEEAINLSKKNFCFTSVTANHYYGINKPIEDHVSLEDLPSYIDKMKS